MTKADEELFHIAIAEQQARIMEIMTMDEPAGMPTNDRQAKAKKWAADVEKNRQKQLAEAKAKKKSVKKSVEVIEPKVKKPAKTKSKTTAKPKSKNGKQHRLDNELDS
jgi:hypothetical protein